jgi:hypothetical protein
VVVNHIQDDLHFCPMKFTHQSLKFVHLTTRGSLCTVRQFGGKETDGIVSPVIGKSFVAQNVFNIEFMDGKKLHGIDSTLRYGSFQ